MIRKAFMAATVLLLLLLVLITPRFIGYREDISTLPRVIVNYGEDELVVLVTSLSATYLYEALFLNVTYLDAEGVTLLHERNTYAVQERVDLNVSRRFSLEAVAVDRRGEVFETRLEVTALKGPEGWTFELLILPEKTPRVLTAEDMMNSPFVTLLERREVEGP
jgi:hypothetical protein